MILKYEEKRKLEINDLIYYLLGLKFNKKFIKSQSLKSYHEKKSYFSNYKEIRRLFFIIKLYFKSEIFQIYYYKTENEYIDTVKKLERFNSLYKSKYKFNRDISTIDPNAEVYKEIEKLLKEAEKNLFIGNKISFISNIIVLSENILEGIILASHVSEKLINNNIKKPIERKDFKFSNKIKLLEEHIKSMDKDRKYLQTLLAYLKSLNKFRDEFIMHPYHLDRYHRIIDKKETFIKKLEKIRSQIKLIKESIIKFENPEDCKNVVMLHGLKNGKSEYKKTKEHRFAFASYINDLSRYFETYYKNIEKSDNRYYGSEYNDLIEFLEYFSFSFLLFLDTFKHKDRIIFNNYLKGKNIRFLEHEQ